MTSGAILLTAGPILGGPSFDPLESLGFCSAIQRLVRTLQNCGVRHILLSSTSGKRAELEKHMARWGVLCQAVPGGASLSASLRFGLSSMAHTCDRLLVLAADIPFLAPSTVQALLGSDALLCRPLVDGAPGGIFSVDRRLFPTLMAKEDLPSPDAVSRACGLSFTDIPVADPGALPDARAKGLFPALLARSSRDASHVSLKLRLCRDRPFFGPGTAQLLSLIESTGSIRDACQQMGLSYSKGRHMIAVMEEELGIPIVLRQQGGHNGGAASLTEEGKMLILRFEQLESRCQALVQQAYREIFPEL